MEIQNIAKIFNALSKEVRLSIFLELVKVGAEGLCPCHLVKMFDLTNSNLSFHLKELENAGLVSKEKKGQFIHYRANCSLVKEMGEFLIKDCQALCDGKNCKTKTNKVEG
ncbi:MAG: helix-turn-helix transcriptional regulator [Alphaproteobacteria bacterium]|nr:helix-turn-helix transcriptional regulator [Alphaproteobacteria bacterium]